MATALFVWELGFGLGHLTQLAPLANAVAARGHAVFAALRDVGRARLFFDPRVKLLAAPFATAVERASRTAHTFAHILTDTGWDEVAALRARAEAWRNLYELVCPDLIVFDHSPTALLAARGRAVRRVIIGNGFTVPPDVCPLPNLRTWLKPESDRFRDDEDAVLARANAALDSIAGQPLQRLAELYGQADRTLLATLPELDPYPSMRPPGTRYWGAVNPAGGLPPQWPDGGGKKVFVYLRACRATDAILRRLSERNASALALVGGPAARWHAQVEHPLLRLQPNRLDIAQVVRDCDLAVLNGNFATSVAMLLGGRPSLQVPIFLEHILTARSVRRLGAGLDAPAARPELVLQKLDALLDSEQCAHGAQRFAQHYREFDPARAADGMLRHCLALLP